MITAPDSFTFVSADADKRYLKVDVVNNVPQRVQVENSAYSFSCGGGNPACANIVFTTNGNIRQFNFANTVLTADNGSGKTLTLKDGNVIHQIQGGVNQPLRTENGVEIYDCATWRQIPNGAATSNVSLNFINQRGNFKSITINGLNSINRSVLLFGNLQNGGTRTQAGLHNQMVMVDDSAGTCLAVLKPVTAGDKNVTFNADGSVAVANAANPPVAGKTCVGNTNPRGCLTITGEAAMEGAFEHVGSPLVFGGAPQIQLNGNPPTSGAITFFGPGVSANSTNSGLSVGFQKAFGSTSNATYTFQQFGESMTLITNFGYECVKNASNDCPGLTVDTVGKRLVFNGVVMFQRDNTTNTLTGKTATFNGELMY